MTGEPDEAILRAPRVVSGPQAQGERAWPNLADVPESKPSYLNQEKAEGLTRRLVQDQKEAESEAARINQTDMGAVHLANDPVAAIEGQTHPVGLLTAPDQPELAPPNPFSALRP